MKYDNTDIHLRYNESRKLPHDTIVLWLNSISAYVSTESIKTIVDLGCGTGRFLGALSNYFPGIVYGVDPSIKMLTKAKETVTSTNVTFAQCSAEYLCFADNSVDLVFLSQVYHHFHNTETAISEIKRILRIDGFVCIRNSTTENLDSCLYIRFFPRAYKDDHELLPTREEIKNLIQGHDLDIIGHHVIHQKFAENCHEYFSKIKLRGLTDLALLPDDEFNGGLKELELYCRENDSGGPVFEEMDLFICKKLRELGSNHHNTFDTS